MTDDKINIEIILKLVAHLAVIDEQIDNREVQVIDEFIKDNHIDARVRQEIHKIFSDEEDKPTIEQLFLDLKNQNAHTKEQAIIVSLSLVYKDGYFDPLEQGIMNSMIEAINFDREEYSKIKSVFENGELFKDTSKEQSFLDKRLKGIIPIVARITGGRLKERIINYHTKLLLSGPEYVEAIYKCRDIALADLKAAEDVLNGASKRYMEVLLHIADVQKQIANSKDYDDLKAKDVLNAIKTNIKEIIINRLEKNRGNINKKKRSVNYYTISFLGRTKAGKSTLHSVITGEGDEFIGVGKLRTTRYNRAYVWENVRIIDTPGIGAPKGKSDEQIAESIIDESDVICYMVTNDSIQESEFAFLKSIKEKNKPVLILLNVKENITDPKRLSIFLKNPRKWLERTDEKSLAGHHARIREYTKKYYKNDYFDIFPVMLLAAHLSKKPENKEIESLLRKGSNVEGFLDKIRRDILSSGQLKKSQNILDGTIYTLIDNQKVLQSHLLDLTEITNKLDAKSKEFSKFLKTNRNIYRKKLQKVIADKFDELNEYSRFFAHINWNADKENLHKKWAEHLSDCRFEDDLAKEIEKQFNEILEDIKQRLEEISEELKFYNEVKFNSIDFNNNDTFSFRPLFQFAKAVGMLVVIFHPAGWVLLGLGYLGTWFFESEQKIQRRAEENIIKTLKEGIKKNEADTLSKVNSELEKMLEGLETNVSYNFNTLISGFKSLAGILKSALNHADDEISYLNKVFAFRIVNYIQHNSEAGSELDKNKVNKIIAGTKRDYGKSFEITYDGRNPKFDTLEIAKTLQERVVINQLNA